MTKTKTRLACMLCALVVAACALLLAASPAYGLNASDTYSITVSGADPDAVTKAYQILAVDYDFAADAPLSPTYKWANSRVQASVTSSQAVLDMINNGTISPDKMKEIAESFVKSMYFDPDYYKPAGTITGNGDITGLPMGVYVLGTFGVSDAKVYVPASVNLVPTYDGSAWVMPSAQVALKYTLPTINKVVLNPGEVSGSSGVGGKIGDVKHFELTAVIPSYPPNANNVLFNIGDHFSDGLTFNDDVEVYAVRGTTETKLTQGFSGEYLLRKNTTMTDGVTPATFFIIFDIPQIEGYDKVVVRYSGTVNANAVVGNNGNQATLEYTHDIYNSNYPHDTDKSSAGVFAYGIEVNTKDASGNALPGAEYELFQGASKLSFVQTADGEYRLALPKEAGVSTTLVANTTDGTLKLAGLDTGDFELAQTKAPNGYAKLADPKKISLVDTNADGTLDDMSSAWYVVDVINAKPAGGIDLPVTGDAGTLVFVLVGVICVAGGSALLLSARKKGDEF